MNKSCFKQFTPKTQASRLQTSANPISPKNKALPPLPLGIKRNNFVTRYGQSSDVPHNAHKYIESQMSMLYRAIESCNPSTSGLPVSPATKPATSTNFYEISQPTVPSLDAEKCWRDTHIDDTRRFASYIPDSVRLQLHSSNGGKKPPIYNGISSAEIDTALLGNLRPTYSRVEAPVGLRILKDNILPSALAATNPPPYSENDYSFF